MFGIDAIITEHFEMLFGYVNDQTLNEFHGRNAFRNGFVVFMPGIVESNKFTIVFVNTGRGDDRPPQIPCNVFDGGLRSAVIGFRTNIEAFFVILINVVSDFFERGAQPLGKHIQEHFTKSISEEGIVEVGDFSPWRERACPTFGNKSVDMGVPFQVSAKSVKDADEARSKVFRFINFIEHTKDDIPDGMKQTREKRAVFQEKGPQFFRDSGNTVSVIAGNQFAGDV